MTNQFSKIQLKEKPKICAIDLEPEIIEALKNKGFQCFAGTLGSQVTIPNTIKQNTHPCLLNYNFPPNLHEYDIVIIDLQFRSPIPYKVSEHTYSSFKGSEQTILLSCYPETIFDPRPLSSNILATSLSDFFEKETLMIVFSAPQEVVEYHSVLVNRYGNQEQDSVRHSLYKFLPCLKSIRNKTGRNVLVYSGIQEEIRSFLQKYIKDFLYEVVFEYPREWLGNKYVDRDDFMPLLLNSDHENVGFFDYSLNSSIFTFPQLISGKKEFLTEFLDEILPGVFPNVFPFSEQFSWLKSENYLLPNQANFIAKKAEIKDEYYKALAKIEAETQQNQAQYQFLHNLLIETGGSLVKSVEYFLSWLGFINIINMDEANPEIKEEDLQIPLQNGLLVVEIKGIGGTSKDSECSQISKIKYRRERERSSFDVFALYLVNHQRYLPPHERKNPPFTEH